MTAVVIATITSCLTACMAALFFIYYVWLLQKVKGRHTHKMEEVGCRSSHEGKITHEKV